MRWLAVRIGIFSILALGSYRCLNGGGEIFGLSQALSSSFFLFAWGAFLAVLLVPYLFGTRFISKVLLLVLMFLVLAGTLTTRSFRHQIVTQAREGVHAISRQPARALQSLRGAERNERVEMPGSSIRNRNLLRLVYRANKIGHFVLFALLTLGLLAVSRPGRWPVVLCDVMLLAGSTEMMQFFLQGRAPGLKDGYLDGAGAVLGLLLWLVYTAWRSKNRSPFS